MNVTAIKTHTITISDTDIYTILEKYLPPLNENSIVVITSKIVSITQGRTIPIDTADKDALIIQEAEQYIPRTKSKYNFLLTIKNNILLPSAGIDESNADGNYILWPEDPQRCANDIRSFLKKKHNLNNIGVLIVDSKTTPLRWGTTGIGVAHSGFDALKNYIGTKDLFGRVMKVTSQSILDGLAASAVLVMGEGDEATPLAVITDIPFVTFQDRNPTNDELSKLHINIEDDLYEPVLSSAHWKRKK